MKFRKLRRNVKAISPVISVLLMIAVAVVASLVVYAWVMGYIGFQTSKTGQAVQIQSVSFNSGKITTVYLQNMGDGAVTMIPNQSLYVQGTLYTGPTIITPTNPTPGVTGGTQATLKAGDTAQVTPASADQATAFTSGQMITIKVTTQGGTYSQITQQVP